MPPFDSDKMMTWVGFTHSDKLCPSCAALLGVTKKWSEWIASGVTPGSGQTICGDYCRCMVVEEASAQTFQSGLEILLNAPSPKEIIDNVIAEIAGVETAILTVTKYPWPDNIIAKWEVLLEKEIGFSTNVQEDIQLALRHYQAGGAQREMLEKEYPLHFSAIQSLLGL